jgi:hypothetical protein
MGMRLPPDVLAKVLAQAAPAAHANPAPRPKRKARAVALGTAAAWVVVLRPACRVVTEANTHEHWTARAKRGKAQRAAVEAAWWLAPVMHASFARFAPLRVTLTHAGSRMDDDNLAGAFKAVRDEVARLIGIDDGDARLIWVYAQVAGAPGIEIRIEGAE